MSQVLSTLNLSKSISISPVRPVINNYWMNKGVSCGAASVGEYNRVIYYYQESWQRKLATVKSLKADVSSVSPFSERLEELWVACVFLCWKWSYAIGGNMVTRKQESEKRSLIPWRLRVPIWKKNFCSKVLRLS